MAEKSNLTFQGPGPFHLPTVQSAIATGDTDNGVKMTLRAILPERGYQPESVSAQMLSRVARQLGMALIQAADTAEKTS